MPYFTLRVVEGSDSYSMYLFFLILQLNQTNFRDIMTSCAYIKGEIL